MTKILWVEPVGAGVFDGDTLALVGAVRRGGFEPVVGALPGGPPHLAAAETAAELYERLGLSRSKVGGYPSPPAA